MITEFYLFIASVFTAGISGVVGMAGGVTLLAMMTFFLPFAVIIPIHGLNQLTSNSLRAFILRRHLIKPVIVYFAIGSPLGALGAYYFIDSLTSDRIPLLIISAFIIYVVFKPKRLPDLKLKEWQYGILGLVSGFMSILIGATGPLQAPFFLRDDYTKEEIVATKAGCQFITHILKIPVFLTLGFNYLEYKWLIALMIFGTVLGTNLGVKILEKISPQIFVFIYKSVLILVAARLIHKAVFF